MSTTDLTLEEMGESLTGFDEIAIETHFGKQVNDLLTNSPTMGIRALIFVHKTRDGSSPTEAKAAAMSLTLKDVMAFFDVSGAEDFDPNSPDSESGKDDSLVA